MPYSTKQVKINVGKSLLYTGVFPGENLKFHIRNAEKKMIFSTGCVPVVLPESARYYLIQQKKKWSDAQAYCQGTYTDLAIIENNDQMVRFQQESQYKQFSSSAWIGLYNDINSWRWSFRNEPLGSMRKWMNGEPNNSGGRQACVALTPWGWTDKDCTSKYAFVCIDGEGQYIVYSFTLAADMYYIFLGFIK